MESNSLNQTICFPRRYDTPHNGVYCLRRIKQARMYYFSICTRILQNKLFDLSNLTRVLPKFFLQNPQKRIEFHKPRFLYVYIFYQIYLCSTHFLKNPIPDNLILTTILSALRRRLTPIAYTLEI